MNTQMFITSTGEKIAKVINSNSSDLNDVINSSNVFKIWSPHSAKRSRIMSKYKALLEENIDILAEIVSQEHGKILMMKVL